MANIRPGVAHDPIEASLSCADDRVRLNALVAAASRCRTQDSNRPALDQRAMGVTS